MSAVLKQFWTVNRDGGIKIVSQELFNFLSENGYKYMLIGEERIPSPVKVVGKIIERQKMSDLKKFVIDTINDSDEVLELSTDIKIKVLSALAEKTHLFQDPNLYFLEQIEPDFYKDTNDTCYIFFKSMICEITQDKETFTKIDDSTKYVLKDHICKHYIDETINLIRIEDSVFHKFLKYVCSDKSETKAKKKLESLQSIIGYLVSRYKDSALTKAVILMDEDYSDQPMGRTGKTLLLDALSHVRPTIIEDGKKLKLNGSFAFSRVYPGVNILGIDDLRRNCNFEDLFPLISNGIEVERKYKDKYRIPYSESPKVALTTNTYIEGEGDSNDARKIEFGFSRYFNAKHQPTDEFGKRFFDEWQEEDWKGFYLCIIECVKKFLKEGLIQPPAFNARLINLIRISDESLVEYLTDEIEYGKKYIKKEFYTKIITKFPKLSHRSQKTITSWIKLYAQAYDLTYKEWHSGSESYFHILE